MKYRVRILKHPQSWGDEKTFDDYVDLPLPDPCYLYLALCKIPQYLNATYGKDNWFLSEAGQFVHREAVGGDHPVAILEAVEESIPQVFWSEEDQEYVAYWDKYSSLSFLATSPMAALKGFIKLVDEVEADMARSGERDNNG